MVWDIANKVGAACIDGQDGGSEVLKEGRSEAILGHKGDGEMGNRRALSRMGPRDVVPE